MANILWEISHIFWTTWVISMKFLGKIWHMIILKVAKNQGFILSLEDTLFEKPQGDSNWPPTRFRVKVWLFYEMGEHFLQRILRHSRSVSVRTPLIDRFQKQSLLCIGRDVCAVVRSSTNFTWSVLNTLPRLYRKHTVLWGGSEIIFHEQDLG